MNDERKKFCLQFIVHRSAFIVSLYSFRYNRFVQVSARESNREAQESARARVLPCSDQQISHTQFLEAVQ
jgi:hypothetical protein